MLHIAIPVEIAAVGSVIFLSGIHRIGLKSKRNLRREVTAREKAEASCKQALEFSEMMLQSSPAGILTYDGATGQCVQANPAAAAILGGTVESLLLQNMSEIPLWLDTDFSDAAQQVILNGRTQSMEKSYDSSFGKHLLLHCSISRFYSGERLHYMLGIVDLTEQRRLAEENQNIAEQMLHVQKLESLGVLAGGVAHDTNNILTAILGNAGLSRMYIDEKSPAHLHIDQIEKAARRAADLAKQMLDYSGKGRYEIAPHNLGQLVQETGHMFQVSISKKASLIFNLTPNLPPANCDATQIRQVIMNLVINGSEALGGDPGEIRISTGVSEAVEDLPPGEYVFFEVTDTGCGMSNETLALIFDPYFTTKFTGRGLGMSAVLGIIKGHQGAIMARSEEGEGTTFRVVLPVAVEATLPTTEIGFVASKNWKGEGLVLLVDDEEPIRDMGKRMLERLGFEVKVAVNGQEGLDVFRAHQERVVCVILDLTMPILDGAQAYREIRKNSQIPVVITSGYTADDITIDEGAFFLHKPYTFDQLQQKLRKLVEVRGA